MNIIVNEKNRKNISLYYCNDNKISFSFRYLLEIKNNFTLYVAHKFDDEIYTKYSNCKLINHSKMDSCVMGKFSFETKSNIKKENIMKVIRKEKLNKINDKI